MKETHVWEKSAEHSVMYEILSVVSKKTIKAGAGAVTSVRCTVWSSSVSRTKEIRERIKKTIKIIVNRP